MDRPKIKRVIFSFILCVSILSDSKAAPVVDDNSSFQGTLYGFVHDVRPDFSAITVKPTETSDHRHRVNIDSSTQVFINKKKRKSNALYLGDKVAIRYFGRGTTIIADAIYVVFGEFVPKDYVIKKKFIVVKKAGEEKGKEGHGEKKEAKPKGH
jgi:hypothetical protein